MPAIQQWSNLTAVEVTIWKSNYIPKTTVQGPVYWHRLTFIAAWISNYIHHKIWDEITYPLGIVYKDKNAPYNSAIISKTIHVITVDTRDTLGQETLGCNT